MDTARRLVLDVLARRPDLDMKKLSLAIGRNHAYLQQYLTRGSPRELPESSRLQLAPLMGVAPDDLRASGPYGALPGGVYRGEMRGVAALRAQQERADLPVYASAEGGNGAIIITSEPIDFVRRPEPLAAVKDGFGCYVIGDSMSPAYEQGDLLLVHPGKPVKPGDDCVFLKEAVDGARQGLVKRLLKISGDKWRVRQFNPARDFDLDRGQWQKAQLVVGKYNR
ncbi:MAG: S24 family peptidase [Alphaproteobacteria bacterium]|nr:S24 family peptidase [Alphaproteobacteria bacterium]